MSSESIDAYAAAQVVSAASSIFYKDIISSYRVPSVFVPTLFLVRRLLVFHGFLSSLMLFVTLLMGVRLFL